MPTKVIPEKCVSLKYRGVDEILEAIQVIKDALRAGQLVGKYICPSPILVVVSTHEDLSRRSGLPIETLDSLEVKSMDELKAQHRAEKETELKAAREALAAKAALVEKLARELGERS